MKKVKEGKKYITLITLISIIIIIISVVIILKIKNKRKLKLDELETIAIYGYLEENIIDPTTVYIKAGLLNEVQVFQNQLIQTLNTYFEQRSQNSVLASEILELMDNKYITTDIDLSGIIISGYEYSNITKTFQKCEDSYPNIKFDTEYNDGDYIDKKTKIKEIQKNKDNMYVIIFDIIDKNMPDNSNVETSGKAVLKVEKNIIIIEKCTLNRKN